MSAKQPSSPKKRAQTAASPQRNQSPTQRQTKTIRFTETMLRQGENSQLQLELKDKEIELEHKLNTLIALNEKLQVFNDLKQDVAENKNFVRESEQAREELQVVITTTAQRLKEDTEMKEKFQDSLKAKVQELMDLTQEQESQAARTQQEHLDRLNQQDARHHGEINQKNNEINSMAEQSNRREEKWNAEWADMQRKHDQALRQKADEFGRLDKWYHEELAAEKERNRREVTDLRSRHATELANRDRAFKEQEDRFLQQLRQLQERLDRAEREHLDAMRQQQELHDKRNMEWQNEIRSLNSTYKTNLDRLTQTMESLRVEKDTEIRRLTLLMEEERSTYELKINELEITLQRYQQMTVKLESTVLELNTRLAQKADVEAQLDLWKAHHDSMEDSKQRLQDQLEGASSYIHQLDEKYYESQTTQLEMLKQMKEYEADLESSHQEIEQLRQYIIDLKSRIAVYIPVKGDTIDKKLAEYINNYPDRQKLKIMFMRESEGVYQFGTKRVYVKCAKDKIEIKVGGGFLSLDEFLDQYTPVELEKLERKDPMRRMTDRIALQKTLGRVANVSPTASPTRAGPRKKTAV